MKKLIFVWVAGAVVLIGISVKFNLEATSFHGIADSREITINNENPVEIRKVGIIPGQTIKKGEFLVELYRPELEMKILDISHQSRKILAQNVIDSNYIKSQINQLKAQRASRINEIKSKISVLDTKYKINKELASELKSVHVDTFSNSSKNESNRQLIENLENELQHVLNELDLKIEQLQKFFTNPVSIQIQNLKEELNLLQQESIKLMINSPIDGIVGSVNFKTGEKVSPFTPIITLHTKSPSYINGYIHENAYNEVSIGQEVTVISLTNQKCSTKGSVVGVGARMIAFPSRLWKMPDLVAWGREVQVKIPEMNSFLLGEKVLVTMKN